MRSSLTGHTKIMFICCCVYFFHVTGKRAKPPTNVTRFNSSEVVSSNKDYSSTTHFDGVSPTNREIEDIQDFSVEHVSPTAGNRRIRFKWRSSECADPNYRTFYYCCDRTRNLEYCYYPATHVMRPDKNDDSVHEYVTSLPNDEGKRFFCAIRGSCLAKGVCHSCESPVVTVDVSMDDISKLIISVCVIVTTVMAVLAMIFVCRHRKNARRNNSRRTATDGERTTQTPSSSDQQSTARDKCHDPPPPYPFHEMGIAEGPIREANSTRNRTETHEPSGVPPPPYPGGLTNEAFDIRPRY